jgi:hypothetical protein
MPLIPQFSQCYNYLQGQCRAAQSKKKKNILLENGLKAPNWNTMNNGPDLHEEKYIGY